MAYMDFRGIEPALATGPAARLGAGVDPAATVADFAPLEWTVISLARHESLSGVTAPGRASRLLTVLFGTEQTRPLADPKLEALRKVAVSLWHRRTPRGAAIAGFRRHGFTSAHLALLRANIAAVAGAVR